MILYPKLYISNVTEISLEILKKNNIKALILDVDNTLIDYYQNMPEGIKIWCNNLKDNGIKFCILSNSNKKEKVEKVSKILEIPYIYFAKKPFKKRFQKSKKIIKSRIL